MADFNTLKQKSVSGVVSYSFRTIALYLIAVGATAILSAYLSPEDFGIYFVVTSLIGLFTFLSDVGLAAALVQKKQTPTIAEQRTTFTVQQILAVTIFLLAVGLTPFWVRYWGPDKQGLELIYVMAFSFILASFKTVPSILLERKLDFHKLVIPQVVEQICFYTIAVVLAIKGYGVRSFTIAVLVRGFVGVITIYLIQSWQIGFALSKQALSGLINFGAKFQLNDLLARLKDDLYIVVLSKFLSAGEMGYIGWAKRWSMFPYQFSVNSVVAITFPTYSRLQEHKPQLKKAIEKSLYFISLIIFPVLMGMIAIARPLIEIVPQYHKWLPALPSLYLFCINIGWAAMSSPLTNTLNAIGQINKTLKLMIMWTGLTWALTPLGLKWFGFSGVALVSALVATTSLATIYMVKQVIDLRFLDQIWRQLIASIIMGTVLITFSNYWSQSFIWLGLGVLLGVIIYMAILSLLGLKRVMHELMTLWKWKQS
jgi:O-antigen/teichoic acid export membrane protein